MKLYIDGFDVSDCIAYQGFKWSRNDIDGPNAGRNKAGTMIRDRVATKMRLDVKCRPLKSDRHSNLMRSLMPEFVSVVYEDPVYGSSSHVMYSNNITSEFCIARKDGTEYWHNTQFPLVER